MPVTVYKSSDASAPVLSNVAGSLVGVLDACLVNGYGAKAGAGWTKPFSSSSTGASYKQGAGSNGLYLNVDDTQPNFARARGFETMSAYNVGANLFPTDGQQSGGTFFQKTNNAVANQSWVLVANSKTFYFFSSYDNTPTHLNGVAFYFGDFPSEKPGDTGNTMIIGAVAAAQTSGPSNAATTTYVPYYSFVSNLLGGHYLVRTHTGAVGSAPMGKHVNLSRLGYTAVSGELNSYAMTGGGGSGAVTYPSPASGGMYVSPIWLHEMQTVRGRLPGIYLFQATGPRPAHGDTYTGSGDMAGKTFICVNIFGSQLHIETTDTW